MKVRYKHLAIVELTAAEVIEACREHAIARRDFTLPGFARRDVELVTADGFDDHDRVFSLTFEVKP